MKRIVPCHANDSCDICQFVIHDSPLGQCKEEESSDGYSENDHYNKIPERHFSVPVQRSKYMLEDLPKTPFESHQSYSFVL